MKKFILSIIILMLVSVVGKAQTNVTGGIYANTTWSLTGSPYIVTDTVVVFPGVILSIQPGVIVKFNNKAQIEVRQSAIRAWGTAADSITFTSNTTSTAGSYSGIYLTGGTMTSKFNYCIFKYADAALTDLRNGSGDTIIIKNSNFSLNNTGLFAQGTSYGIADTCNFRHNVNYGIQNSYGIRFTNCDISYNSTGLLCDSRNTLLNCTVNHNNTGLANMSASQVNNCVVNYNQTGITCNNLGLTVKYSTISSNTVTGISIMGSGGDSVYRCQILNNGIAINDNSAGSYPCSILRNTISSNNIGIKLTGTSSQISCNTFCSNSSYALQYTGVNNVTVTKNYWCTPDSTSTETVIYDGYDNVSYGLVHFMPLDTSYCSATTGITMYETQNFSFNAYPNPATNNLVLELPAGIAKADIKITNLLGELVYSTAVANQQTTIDVSAFANGIYIIQTTAGGNSVKKKFIKQ